MNTIKLTRMEFHLLLASIITIPIIVFITGFYMGSSHQVPRPVLQASNQIEPTLKPIITDYSIAQNEIKLFDSIEQIEQIEQIDDINLKENSKSIIAMQEEKATLDNNITTLNETNLNQIPQHLFAVQVGSFSNLNNANNYKVKLKSNGVDARILSNTANRDKPTYRVIIGLYENENEAETVALKREHQLHQDAFVAMLY